MTETWDLVCFSDSSGPFLSCQLSWLPTNSISPSNLKLFLVYHWLQMCCQILLQKRAHRPSFHSLVPSTKKLSLILLPWTTCSLLSFIFKINFSQWNIYYLSKAWLVSILCLVNKRTKKMIKEFYYLKYAIFYFVPRFADVSMLFFLRVLFCGISRLLMVMRTLKTRALRC